MKKCSLILFLVLISIDYCSAQLLLITDTLNIGEVKVVPSLPDGTSGYKLKRIEQETIRTYSGQSIATLLQNNTSLYIKNYGVGGLASSSFRGMGANHTEILWEGQRLNSPMLGSGDFTTIPTFFIDILEVFYGANPAGFGNRGPGGAISFSGSTDWKKGTELDYTQDIGSYSMFSEGLKLKTGSSNFQYQLKAYFRSAVNDFKYYTNTSSDEYSFRQESDEKSRGILQEFYFRSRESVFSAKIWYNNNTRHLPGGINIIQSDNNEMQSDESVRAILRYRYYNDNFKLEASSSYITDWLNYKNKLLEINSKNKADTYVSRISGDYLFNSGVNLNTVISVTNIKVNSNNYFDIKRRNDLSVDFAFDKVFFNSLGVHASAGQRILESEILPFQASLGLDYKVLPGENLHIKGSVGKAVQVPTLNDLYWIPGGNPDLTTESSFNSELSSSMAFNTGNSSAIGAEITVFRSSIKGMIVWLPLNGSIWQPRNMNNIESQGLEFEANFFYSSGEHNLKTWLNYSLTDVRKTNKTYVNDESVNKQLIYVPRNSGSLRLSYSYSKLSAEWRTVYTGKRFISSDNSEYLSSYTLHNCSLGMYGGKGKLKIRTALMIDNIFAHSYVNVIAYPMPLRSYRISLNLNFGNR